jgi:hypothetical protein
METTKTAVLTSVILVSYSLLYDQILKDMEMLVAIMSISGEIISGFSRMRSRYLDMTFGLRFEVPTFRVGSRQLWEALHSDVPNGHIYYEN